jgi:hypothetical protein
MMDSLMMYLVKVNVLAGIFYLTYYALFKNEKNFRINRSVLLGMLLFIWILPLSPHLMELNANRIPNRMTVINPFMSLNYNLEITKKASVPHPAKYTMPLNSTISHFSGFNWMQVLIGIYCIVAGILLLRFITQLLNVYFLIQENKKQKKEGIIYCEQDGDLSPFSFFNYLFVNQAKYEADQFQQIIMHEKVHIQQWHSIDVLFGEIVYIILWVNPFAFYLKRQLKLNLEYIADEGVINAGFDKKEYQFNLLYNTLNPATYPLTNLFNSSKIKQRIKMINTQKKSILGVYKYFLVLPLLLYSYFLINIAHAKANAGWITNVKGFEGVYQRKTDKWQIYKVTAVNNDLLATSLQTGEKLHLIKKSDLEFNTNENGGINVRFVKDNDGKIKEAWSTNKANSLSAVYIKIKNYKRELKKEVSLKPEQLKILEGIYQFENNKDAYIKIIANTRGLILRQLWNEIEIPLYATGEFDFDNKSEPFPVRFVKDENGKTIKIIALEKDVWNKIDNYKPIVKKEVELKPDQLKVLEGTYQLQTNRKLYLQITATENGIIFKQLWNNKSFIFSPLSANDFYIKDRPLQIKFIKNQDGIVTRVLVLEKDLWDKIN